MSVATLALIVRRDITLSLRRPAHTLMPLAFFMVAASLFPLGVGPEPAMLTQIGPGVVWVCALLSSMLSVEALFSTDFADGSLEQMLLADPSAYAVALAKILVHWLTTGLPLLLTAPLLGLWFGLSLESVGILCGGLAVGTPVLSLFGGLGAALTLGLRNAAVLNLLLILPLCIPVLIFGAGAVSAADSGLAVGGHFALLGALLLLGILGIPVATAAALRIAV